MAFDLNDTLYGGSGSSMMPQQQQKPRWQGFLQNTFQNMAPQQPDAMQSYTQQQQQPQGQGQPAAQIPPDQNINPKRKGILGGLADITKSGGSGGDGGGGGPMEAFGKVASFFL